MQGCTNYSGSAYSGTQVRSAQTVEYGTVEVIRQVTLEENRDAVVGTTTGGVLGGVVGSVFGGGKGHTLATAGGAALGALLGYGAEKGITKQTGVEIQVRMENGQTLAITQATDEEFLVGERVRVLRDAASGTARVSH